jgi:rhodanese-related sulfurtransferase
LLWHPLALVALVQACQLRVSSLNLFYINKARHVKFFHFDLALFLTIFSLNFAVRRVAASRAVPAIACSRRVAASRPSRRTICSVSNAQDTAPNRPAAQVRNVTPKDAAALVADGWVLLDTRPPNEIEKAQLLNAIEVPLFVVDDETSINNLIKQATALGMGGWWLGGSHMKRNENFLNEVQAKIPKDSKGVVVVCQKGLRSLTACEQLSRAGYPALAWINGGLDTAQPGDLPTKDGKDIRFGGIGGLSEILGWTEVQQDESKGFAGGYQNILKAFAIILALDTVWFLYTVFNH